MKEHSLTHTNTQTLECILLKNKSKFSRDCREKQVFFSAFTIISILVKSLGLIGSCVTLETCPSSTLLYILILLLSPWHPYGPGLSWPTFGNRQRTMDQAVMGKTVQGQSDEENVLLSWLSSDDTLPLLANRFTTWHCASTKKWKCATFFQDYGSYSSFNI